MSDSSHASTFEAMQDFHAVRFETFRPFAIRLGFLVPCFPILTLLTDGLERPDLWTRFLISRALWTAVLLAYPVAMTRRAPRNLLPWVLYGCATLMMILVMREQVHLGLRVPQILLSICLMFVIFPMLGVPFSWLENALGVGVLLLVVNVQLFEIPELFSYLPRLELVALFLVASMGFVHQQFERFLVNQFAYQRKIEEFARKDPLTGICNRRYFLELGERLLKLGVRPKRPSSLIMLDLDHFKAVNDRFGHAAGDAVIRATAHLMSREVRETDLVARIQLESEARTIQKQMADLFRRALVAEHRVIELSMELSEERAS
jgi:diguanylate cyclase (GGDEF)-like protein